MILILLVLNLVISLFNSWSVGRGWAESKAAGGWARVMSWAGAVMAVCGFTWCYAVVAMLVGHATGYLDAAHAEGVLRLGYLVIILPILGSGLAITVQSWAHFWRQRSFGSGALAGWNTFAQVYNTVGALEAVPESLGFLSGLLKGGKDDKDSTMAKLMVALAVLAVIGGILTAVVIIRVVAKRHARDVSWGMQTRLEEQRTRQRFDKRRAQRTP